jgi:hypothetical protein
MSRTRTLGVPSAVLLGTLALAGCTTIIDPFQREGVWRPSGVNDANLASQVANPADLAQGREDARGSVRTSTRAVERLWTAAPAPAAQATQAAGFGARSGQGQEAQR